MALPMLPKEEIATVYRLLSDVSCLNLNQTEIAPLNKLRCYIKKEWINRNDFSVYGSIQKTNNCCEVYHKSLKSIIRVKRPNLWAFMEFLEKNLKKYDLEYQRKKNGLEIGDRSKKDVDNEEKGNRCKAKLENKEFTPVEYLEEVSNTIGNQQYYNYSDSTDSEENYDEDSDDIIDEEAVINQCVICLQNRVSTFVLLPCGHAQICGNCEPNFNLGDRCPTCRSLIMNKQQIFQ